MSIYLLCWNKVRLPDLEFLRTTMGWAFDPRVAWVIICGNKSIDVGFGMYITDYKHTVSSSMAGRRGYVRRDGFWELKVNDYRCFCLLCNKGKLVGQKNEFLQRWLRCPREWWICTNSCSEGAQQGVQADKAECGDEKLGKRPPMVVQQWQN